MKGKKKSKFKYNLIKYIFTAIFLIAFVMITIALKEVFADTSDEFIVKQDSVSFEESAEGVFIRKETILKEESDKDMVQIVSDGKKVANGERVFRYYSSEEEEMVSQIKDISKRINEIIEQTGIRVLSSNIASIETSIEDTIDQSYEVNDILKLQEYMKKIDEYMDKKTEETSNSSNNAEIQELMNQKRELENKLNESSDIISTPEAGLISYRIDGYEDKLVVNDEKDFSYVTKELLDEIDIKAGSLIPISTKTGKLVNNFEAYIAIYMNTERSSFVNVGDSIKLRIEASKIVKGTIVGINYVNGKEDESILIVKIVDNIENFLEYRKVQIDVIWWEYTGLKLINSAIFEENGLNYVYRKKLGTVEKVLVKVLRQNEVYSIVENYTDDELRDMNFKDEDIKGRNQIKLYDRIITKYEDYKK